MITEMLAKDVDITSVSVLVSHADISMTYRHAEASPETRGYIPAELV